MREKIDFRTMLFHLMVICLLIQLYPMNSSDNEVLAEIQILENNSRVMFKESINVTWEKGFLYERMYYHWPDTLNFIDMNSNDYPEIVTGTNMNSLSLDINYTGKGLHRFEYSDTEEFNAYYHYFNFTDQAYEINLDMDEYPDLVLTTYVIHDNVNKKGFIIDNDQGNLSMENWTFSLPNNNFMSDPVIGDINADGRYDFATRSDAWDGIHPAVNIEGHNFTCDGWENGLPKYDDLDPDNSYKYISSEHGLWDINNDGWLDICSAMGDGFSYRKIGPCQFYNWISDGTGNWTSASDGFPTYESGMKLNLADIDNDGDLDYFLYTYDRNKKENCKYFFENLDGKGWKHRQFPINTSNFAFDDIDLDGYIDMIYVKVKKNTDEYNKTVNVTNTVWIAYGNGNWEWEHVKQMSVDLGWPGKLYLKDLDLDGDKDLVFSHNIYKDITSGLDQFRGIMCFINSDEREHELLFTKTPENPHMRGGSAQRFEWSSCYAAEYAGKEKQFDLMVSYTGKDGPYFPVETGISTYWRDVVLPRVPSSDAFFKIIWNDLEAFAGPYTIHTGNDTSIITLEDPIEGEFLIGNDNRLINITTDPCFEDGMVSISVKHANGTIDIGDYHLSRNKRYEIPWTVPDNIYELNCTIYFDFDFQGKSIFQPAETRFNIAPEDIIPSSIDAASLPCPIYTDNPYHLTVTTNDGTDITEECEYSSEYDIEDMRITSLGGGEFLVYPYQLGNYSLRVEASRFGRSIFREIDVHVYKSITSIEIRYPDRVLHVGDKFNVKVNVLDPEDNIWDLDDDEYELNIEGDLEMMSDGFPSLRMMGLSPGIINISFRLFEPRINSSVEIQIKPRIGQIIIDDDGCNILFTNEKRSIPILIVDDRNDAIIKNISIDIECSRNCQIQLDKNILYIESDDAGPLTLSMYIQTFNESYQINKDLLVIDDIGDLIIEGIDDYIEVGKNQTFSTRLMDINDEYEIDDHLIEDITYSLHIEMSAINRTGISIKGMLAGMGHATISISVLDRTRSFEYTFLVENTPYSISVGIPDFLLTGQDYKFMVSVRNYLDQSFEDYSFQLRSYQIDSTFSDGMLTINTEQPSEGWLELTVSKRNVSVSFNKTVKIIPDAVSIYIEPLPERIYIDHIIKIEPELVDINGVRYNWSDWTVIVPSELSLISSRPDIELLSAYPGNFTIDLHVDLNGKELFDSIEIYFESTSVIDDLIVLHSKGSNIVELKVLDQYGNNITRYCNVTWESDVEHLEFYKVFSNTDSVDIVVNLNGTQERLEYSFGSQIHSNENDYVYYFFIILMILMVIGILILFRKNVFSNPDNNIKKRKEDSSHGFHSGIFSEE